MGNDDEVSYDNSRCLDLELFFLQRNTAISPGSKQKESADKVFASFASVVRESSGQEIALLTEPD